MILTPPSGTDELQSSDALDAKAVPAEDRVYVERVYRSAVSDLISQANAAGKMQVTWPYQGDESAVREDMSLRAYINLQATCNGDPQLIESAEQEKAKDEARSFAKMRSLCGFSDAEAAHCTVVSADPVGRVYTVTANLHQ